MTTAPGRRQRGTVRARALAATDALPRTFPHRHVRRGQPAARPGAPAVRAGRHRRGGDDRRHARSCPSRSTGTCIDRAASPSRPPPRLVRRWPDADLPTVARRSGRRARRRGAAERSGRVPVPSSRVCTPQRADRPRPRPRGGRPDRRTRSPAWCAAYLDRGPGRLDPARPRAGPVRLVAVAAPRDPGLRRLAGRDARRRVQLLPTHPMIALAQLVDELALDGRLGRPSTSAASLRRLPGWASALARSGDSDDLRGLPRAAARAGAPGRR